MGRHIYALRQCCMLRTLKGLYGLPSETLMSTTDIMCTTVTPPMQIFCSGTCLGACTRWKPVGIRYAPCSDLHQPRSCKPTSLSIDQPLLTSQSIPETSLLCTEICVCFHVPDKSQQPHCNSAYFLSSMQDHVQLCVLLAHGVMHHLFLSPPASNCSQAKTPTQRCDARLLVMGPCRMPPICFGGLHKAQGRHGERLCCESVLPPHFDSGTGVTHLMPVHRAVWTGALLHCSTAAAAAAAHEADENCQQDALYVQVWCIPPLPPVCHCG